MGLTVNALVCKLEGEQLISTNINKNKKQNEQDSSFRYCLAHFYALSALFLITACFAAPPA